MRVRWNASARQDRREIVQYIARDNPGAAVRMNRIFSDAANRLAEHPKMGKPGQIAGTRELLAHRSYRLVYEIVDDTVWVLTLIHTARLWPPMP